MNHTNTERKAVHQYKTYEMPLMAVPKRSGSPKIKKVKSKASKQSSIPRRKSDDSLPNKSKKKKKRNGTGVKRSKSFGEEPSLTPQAPFYLENMGISPSMLAMLEERSSASPTNKPQQMIETLEAVLPKRSSTRSEKSKSKPSTPGSLIRRQSEHCIPSTKKKRHGSKLKRSKSFGEQSSSKYSSSQHPSVLAMSMLGPQTNTKPQRRSTNTKKLKTKQSKTSSVSNESARKPKRGPGVTRSKSFGDRSGVKPPKRNYSGPPPGIKRSKSFGDSKGTKPTRRVSKQKKIIKMKGKKEAGTRASLLEVLGSTLAPIDEKEHEKKIVKKKGDRKVHFCDQVRVRKITRSKEVDNESIWYSVKELKAHRQREREVKRKARDCHNAKVLNPEGLMTIQQLDVMFQRERESKDAVFDAQDAHEWIREHEAANAIFGQASTSMEPLGLDNIAEEYEIFTVAAIQCAHDRASLLAEHVNLLWDQKDEFDACKGGIWHEIKDVEAPFAPLYHRSSVYQALLAQ